MAELITSVSASVMDNVFSPVLSLFKSRYQWRLRILVREMKYLEFLRGQIEEQIDEGITRGEVIEHVVYKWLEDSNAINKQVKKLVRSVPEKESIRCLGFSCPNLVWRSKLNKDIDSMFKALHILISNGNFAVVSCFVWQEESPFTSIDKSNDHAKFDFSRVMEAVRDSKVDMVGVYGKEVTKLKMIAKVIQQFGREEGLFDQIVAIEVPRSCSDTSAIQSQLPRRSNKSAIQSQLARNLNLQLVKKPEVGRAVQLWCRLNNGKKNLIILGGLSEELNLMDIGIPIPDGNRGCKVLLTSQDRRVWKNMQVDIDFPIEELSHEDARTPFEEVTRDSVHSPEQASRDWGGSPDVITAVGSELID